MCTPVLHVFVEAVQLRELFLGWDGHVVLYGVQGPQGQVEDAHGILELSGQLLDHDGKAA